VRVYISSTRPVAVFDGVEFRDEPDEMAAELNEVAETV
jgi:hypothetical protein